MNNTEKERQKTETTLDAQRVSGGWHFMSIQFVFAGEFQERAEEVRNFVFGILEDDARNGTGLFENNTEIETEPEWLDELLSIDPYDCKHSLTGYYDALKRHNIVGNGGAFLKEQFTKLVFYAIKKSADTIGNNTERPNKVKNDIADMIKMLDKAPIWGLFLQILILQGVCFILENVSLNKGDNGYDEAASLYEWGCIFLAEKEMQFCCGIYGENDLKRIEPFCRYLCTTEVGKTVQETITSTLGEEHPTETTALPKELDKEEMRGLLGKACEAGIIDTKDGQYKWNRTKVLLAYFVAVANEYSGLVNGSNRIVWKPFESLFNMKGLNGTKSTWIKQHGDENFYPNGADEIDDLFGNLKPGQK